jgi:hypothetical protein
MACRRPWTPRSFWRTTACRPPTRQAEDRWYHRAAAQPARTQPSLTIAPHISCGVRQTGVLLSSAAGGKRPQIRLRARPLRRKGQRPKRPSQGKWAGASLASDRFGTSRGTSIPHCVVPPAQSPPDGADRTTNTTATQAPVLHRLVCSSWAKCDRPQAQ